MPHHLTVLGDNLSQKCLINLKINQWRNNALLLFIKAVFINRRQILDGIKINVMLELHSATWEFV